MAGIKILVVEDDGITSMHLQSCLKSLGYAVAGAAADGAEAVAQALATRPDLALLDITLHGAMDGVETARQIRAQLDIPIVYVTAHSSQSLLQQARITEPYGYIIKPFEERELRVTIEMALSTFQLKRQLAESEARYRAISDLVSDFAFALRVAPDGQLTPEWVTDSYVRIMGFTLAESQALPNPLAVVHPDDAPIAHRALEMLMVEKRAGVFELRLIAKSGALRWVRCFVRPEGSASDGRVVRILGAAQDITDHKQTEETLHQRTYHLETLRQMSLELTAQLDLDAVLRSVVSRAIKLLEGDAGDLHLHRPDRDVLERYIAIDRFMTPGDIVLRRGEGLAGQVWETGHSLIVDDYRQWEGRAAVYEMYPIVAVVGVPVRWGAEFLGVLDVWANGPRTFAQADADLLEMFAAQAAIAIKNARLYQAEREQFRQLQESQARLIQAEKMAALGRLAVAVAHEINNPLQVVQGNLELLLEELESANRPEKLKKYLDMAIGDTERIAALVRSVRNLYEPSRWQPYPTDIHAVLEDVLKQTQGHLQRSNITVEREWAVTLPPVQASVDLLTQALLELVANVADRVRATGGALRVQTVLDQMAHPTTQAVPAVRIEFNDTGHAIPPEALPHIFDPAVIARKGRTGLGLFVSYGIIELHGGRIEAASAPGQGTTFTVWLPLNS
jgi:PAS domain S-box-containing protein